MSKTVCNYCYCYKSLFYYTILTILALPVVSDIDFIVMTGNICARLTIFPSLNREYGYTGDRYTGVLPHTFDYNYCWVNDC